MDRAVSRVEHRWLAQQGPALALVGRFDQTKRAIARGLAPPDTDLVPPTISWIPRTTMLAILGRGEFPLLEPMIRDILDHAKLLRHRPMQRAVATVLGCILLLQARAAVAADIHESAGRARQAIVARALARRLVDRSPGADYAFSTPLGQPVDLDNSGARDRPVRGDGPLERRDRPGPLSLDPHRRHPPRARLRQARCARTDRDENPSANGATRWQRNHASDPSTPS